MSNVVTVPCALSERLFLLKPLAAVTQWVSAYIHRVGFDSSSVVRVSRVLYGSKRCVCDCRAGERKDSALPGSRAVGHSQVGSNLLNEGQKLPM